jgi:hypothetical protein
MRNRRGLSNRRGLNNSEGQRVTSQYTEEADDVPLTAVSQDTGRG